MGGFGGGGFFRIKKRGIIDYIFSKAGSRGSFEGRGRNLTLEYGTLMGYRIPKSYQKSTARHFQDGPFKIVFLQTGFPEVGKDSSGQWARVQFRAKAPPPLNQKTQPQQTLRPSRFKDGFWIVRKLES